MKTKKALIQKIMFGHEDAFSRSNGVLHLNVRRFIFVANFPGGVNL